MNTSKYYINTKDWRITSRICNIEPEEGMIYKNGQKLIKQNYPAMYGRSPVQDCIDAAKEINDFMATPLRRWFTLDNRYIGKSEAVKKYFNEVTDKMHAMLPDPEDTWHKYLIGDWTIEDLTRENNKGVSMPTGPGLCEDRAIRVEGYDEKPITIKRHKQLNDLSYKIKALIDKEVKDLKSQEACMLGEMMQRIINLK